MSQRMSATERRSQLLTIMQEMHLKAESQTDFTAEKIAQAAGISTVMLYRLVRAEFQTLRSELPGSRRPTDEMMRTLRIENADLRRQLRDTREKLRTTAVEEIDEAIRLMERLEEENLKLRGEVKLLRKRLQEGGNVFIQAPTPGIGRPHLTMMNSEPFQEGTQQQERNAEEGVP
jgi:AraC-like DNA-binding protein